MPSSFSRAPSRISQVASTGTSVLDSTYDEIIAKPTASESGTNSWRPAPVMNMDGTNTASIQSIERKRAVAVLRQASRTARARLSPPAMCVWMFSISTVASSTSTPTASASPPSVMMLIVCPAIHSSTTAPSSAKGMVNTTMIALRQSRRNSSTIRPVSSAPSSPSVTRARRASFT